MRLLHSILCLSYLSSLGFASPRPRSTYLVIRQDSISSDLPTLSASSSTQPSPTDATESQTASATSGTPSAQSASGDASPASSSGVAPSNSTSTERPSSTISDGVASRTSATPTVTPNNSTATKEKSEEALPLTPRITPALSIGGVVLILTGITYALIGVKNQWIHVFLSTAFLASVAVLVLIVYVSNPPVSNAVQGAYFVGVFMTGLLFGGGALIFKEVTEGLGCLLGGFCLSMWFLTLKAGGLITNTGGKAIFIAIFCVVCWSLSFSHYTRPYGLIGSTSFGGATAFVLGIDCFSKGGLKEFWVYIWALNSDLFPLGTNSYPITRGTRVETVIIVLGTIIGVISQIKLWKIVQDRQKQRQVTQMEDDRRRDAVEEALGRHLERQNDRDRSEWEKRYGDRLGAKRQTVLWSEARDAMKRHSNSSVTEIGSSEPAYGSAETLEMAQMPDLNSRTSLHSVKTKRISNMSVHPIQEVEEDENKLIQTRNAKRDSVLSEGKDGNPLQEATTDKSSFDHFSTTSPRSEQHELIKTPSRESISQIELPQSLKPQHKKPSFKRTSDRFLGEEDARAQKRSSIPSLHDLKRRSLQSLRSKSPRDNEKSSPNAEHSESKEALVAPTSDSQTHSRASSIAATLDEENERIELPPLEINEDPKRQSRPPQIVISPSGNFTFADDIQAGLPPSPSGMSDSFEADPEALVRPAASQAYGFSHDGKDTNGGGLGEGFPRSDAGASQTSSAEALTKDVLDRVPSQMSNVVLSYRTNEWAKHITAADAPIFEEPDPAALRDEEPPTHLADPTSTSPTRSASPSDLSKPPPLSSPVTSVAPSDTGVKVNPEAQAIEPARSRPTSEISSKPEDNNDSSKPVTDLPSTTDTTPPESAVPSRAVSIAASKQNKRSLTDPLTQSAPLPPSQMPKTSRRSSNPMQRQTSTLQHTAIDENTAMDFKPRPHTRKRLSDSSTSKQSQQVYPNNLTRSSSQMSMNQVYPSAVNRSPSFNQSQNRSTPDLIRASLSHRGSNSPYMPDTSTVRRSETRLSDYGTKSHQPLQRNNTDESRREILMADWRMQLAQSHSMNVAPTARVDSRYAQQMMDYEADKLRKEKERHDKRRQEAVVDQSMRTQSMIDAHKEVLKRMQNKANDKLKK